MNKVKLLFVSLCFVFGSISVANAIDFKAKGQFVMGFELGAGGEGASEIGGNNVQGWGNNGIIFRRPDSFNANQRIRLQLEAIASESLSGTVFFEMGESKWGNSLFGAGLGADRAMVELKNAYIDWIIPNTEVKVRMGIQLFSLPSKSTHGSMILTDDAAGIAISNRFNENVALTLFWARPYNDNYQNEGATNPIHNASTSNFLDNADLFGVALPLDFENYSLTPWVSYMMVGQNFMRNNWSNTSQNKGNAIHAVSYGLLPMPFAATSLGLTSPLKTYSSNLNSYANIWHVGLAGKVDITAPLSLAWDFNYGAVDFGSVDNVALNMRDRATETKDLKLERKGFYASLLLEYKMDWGTPSLFTWYSSGDDANPWNGSERIPTLNNISAGVEFSNFASNGDPFLTRKAVFGTNVIGLWGVGLQVKNVSFLEDLKQSFRLNYIGGTNHTDMASYIGGDAGFVQSTNGNGFYLTTADKAVEFGITTEYQLYENLKLYFDVEYLALFLDKDQDVWGDNFTASDAWNIGFNAIYSF